MRFTVCSLLIYIRWREKATDKSRGRPRDGTRFGPDAFIVGVLASAAWDPAAGPHPASADSPRMTNPGDGFRTGAAGPCLARALSPVDDSRLG
jgi:hypothetical protein